MALLVWLLKHPKDADSESLHAVQIERYARSPGSEGASTWSTTW
jgi:hypothetical protein